ncbi:M1 family metallopeptidase [Actinomadura scrupuli]|uniref:M1 family metallopeptidase n=1 Tax=Actinomadura scrupuli TaxID=559629 RepID=UPI003D97F77F
MKTTRTFRMAPGIAAAATAVALIGSGCTSGGTSPTASPPTVSAAPQTPANLDVSESSAGDLYTPGDGNGGYDVQHYGLKLTVNPADQARALDGTAQITARATRDLSRFDLDLTGLTIGSVSVDGAPARYERQNSELVVTPAKPLVKDATFTVSVAYSGTPQPVNDPLLGRYGWIRTPDGVFVACQPSGAHTWFPANDHPSDKATFDFEITAPKELTVIANGEPVGGLPTGTGRPAATESPTITTAALRRDMATSHWQVKDPMATYLATIDIGNFLVKSGRTSGGVPIIVAVDPSIGTVNVEDVYAKTAEITDAWTKLFGPYPFGSTGAIVDNADVAFALETQSRPVFSGFGAQPEIIAHELAHEWFGDSVSVTKWQDIWLNEGFATYAEWTWGERSGGATVQRRYDDRYRLVNDPRWQKPPGDPGRKDMFDQFAVYDRAAMTLHALRKRVGDDKFWSILRTWAKEHRHANGTTPEFIATAERVSGANLDALFQAWLYGKTRPTRW